MREEPQRRAACRARVASFGGAVIIKIRMSDRLLLLHDGATPDVMLDALAAQAGYTPLPLEMLGEPVHACARKGHSCMLLKMSADVIAELPRFLELIRQIPETSPPYVIALLTESAASDANHVLAQGADDVITWPAEQDLLSARLRPATSLSTAAAPFEPRHCSIR